VIFGQKRTTRQSTSQNKRGFVTKSEQTGRLALDKSEGVVKSIVVLGGASSTADLPERLRTKALEI